MAIYLTSDLHFNHNKEFIFAQRGFEDPTAMNTELVKRFNAVVHWYDDVYILGDICLGGAEKDVVEENKRLIESLNGKLHIIRGNHDTDTRIAMYKTCKNVVECGKWSDMLVYNKYHFYLSHFPMITDNYGNNKPLKSKIINLYGHTHQNNSVVNDRKLSYHVGVDSNNFTPVLLDDIIKTLEENA